MKTILTEIKNVLDANFDMIVLAAKKLCVKEVDFESRFNEILAEVSRMQLETYNKITTRKDLMDNATKVMAAKTYHITKLKTTFDSFR